MDELRTDLQHCILGVPWWVGDTGDIVISVLLELVLTTTWWQSWNLCSKPVVNNCNHDALLVVHLLVLLVLLVKRRTLRMRSLKGGDGSCARF
jgi:hypothetical protein